MAPLQDHRLRLTGRLLREEPRPPLALFDATRERSDEFVIVCSWCKRVRVGADWREAEDAVAALGLFDAAVLPQLSHGMCDSCADSLEE